MSYIGSTPENQSFTSGSDYFNGNGSTTVFTLSRTVVSVNDIDVVINNVPQQPNTAYTILGNQITFTSAPPAGSSNIYVRYLTTTNQTMSPGDNTVGTRQLSTDLYTSVFNGFRNKIINGKMEIAQRGTSFPAAGDGTFPVDRFRFGNASAAVATVSQQADVPSSNEFQNSVRVAITTSDASIAASDLMLLQQRIEGYNVRDLIGRDFTLSFRVRSSKTGIHCVSLANGGGTPDRSYVMEYTVNAANTWETKSVTVPGGLITAGAWNWTNGIGLIITWTLAAGSTYQTSAGAWQTGNFIATANQVNCLDTVGNIFAITGVQLEAGSIATPFEHRPYSLELSLCRRYYREMYFGFEGYGTGSTFTSKSCIFEPPMRSTPTVTEQFLDGNNVGAIDLTSVNQWYVWYKLTWSTTGQGYRRSILKINSEL